MTTEDLYLYRVVDVLRVVDADTLDLRISLGYGMTASLRYRLAGVNAPEVYGRNASPQGKEAALFAAAWLDERRDRLYVRSYKGSQAAVGIGDGAFSRWLADILAVLPGESLDNAVSLGDALVEAGLAERSQG